jgi:endogenous inhibitor of DNA gyrase (YacG/DUF329 family)
MKCPNCGRLGQYEADPFCDKCSAAIDQAMGLDTAKRFIDVDQLDDESDGDDDDLEFEGS